MGSRHIVLTALAAVCVVVLFVCTALAQGQPKPPPQPGQPQQPQQRPKGRKVLKEYYAEGEEKLKSFTYKENPPFKITKPGDEWHFVDVQKFYSAQAQAARTQEQRQQIDGFFKICKFIMYNEKLNAEVRVLVGIGYGKKTLDQLMLDIENALKKSYADYKRISCKGKKKSKAVGACLAFEGTPKDQPKDKCMWYLFLKGDAFYQLRIHCEEEKFEDGKKDFDKIYKKWGF